MENEVSSCEVENTIEFLGRKHMLKILKMFFDYDHQGIRFSDFTHELGINTKTLSDRLSELEESGLVRRVIYQTKPIRENYEMTEAGYELSKFFKTLNNFEIKYDKSLKEEIERHPQVVKNFL